MTDLADVDRGRYHPDNRPVCFIISPFVSAPADAGQRKRVLQSTLLFKRAGYRIVFILYAFEDRWYWGWDDESVGLMQRQWDEVYIYPARHNVGSPPENGRYHSLDEWWDESFGAWLGAMLRGRFVDVAVAHNVWLSKALSCFPPGTTKVLDAHDLFNLREGLDKVAASEFFLPTQEGEYFGFSRANFILAIQESEAKIIMNNIKEEVRYLPYDVAEPSQKITELRNDYLKPDRVRFGFIGNNSRFNKLGINALIDALQRNLTLTPAPIELVLAGQVCDILEECDIHAIRLGRVKDENEFYRECDIVLAPIFVGTGMKVKSVDALERGVPTLFSRHAAEGLPISQRWVFENPQTMADAICSIAFHRPALEPMQVQMRSFYKNHNFGAQRRAAELINAIELNRGIIEVDISNSEHRDALPHAVVLALSIARCAAGLARICIISPSLLKNDIDKYMPIGSSIACRSGITGHAGWKISIRYDIEYGALTDNVGHVFDGISSSFSWDPALHKYITSYRTRSPSETMRFERENSENTYLVVPSIDDEIQFGRGNKISKGGIIFEFSDISREAKRYTYVEIFDALFAREIGRVYRFGDQEPDPRESVLFSAAIALNVKGVDSVIGSIDKDVILRNLREYDQMLTKAILKSKLRAMT